MLNDKMAIANVVDTFLDAMPEKGKGLGSNAYASLQEGLDELIDLYNALMHDGGGAAIVFKNNKGKVLAHAAEYNPGNGYGHDLLHSFLHAGVGLVENIAADGLPNGLNLEILTLFSSAYSLNLDSGIVPLQNGIFHGLEVKAYEKGNHSNSWEGFAASHNNLSFREVDKKGVVLIDPYSTTKPDLKSLVNKAMANGGIDPNTGKHDLVVHRIVGSVIYG